jgi:putative SOS response-associated peptidase YedK
LPRAYFSGLIGTGWIIGFWLLRHGLFKFLLGRLSRTSFSDYADTKPRKTPIWFAQSEDRPLMAFAGIWRPWSGIRGTKAEPVEGEHLLYSFLTCEPNGVVGQVHPKAMPVILTTTDEYETWLTEPAEAALQLQRPLLDNMIRIVAEGARSDQPDIGTATAGLDD